MVREVVAFALGRVGGPGSSSSKTQGTPRRPSSMARISPEGPPPTIATFVRGIARESGALRADRPDCGEQRLDRLAREIARDEHQARAALLARPGIERHRGMEYVLRALHQYRAALALDVDQALHAQQIGPA